MTSTPPRWPVAVLGATGAVGQAFIRLLDAHPWFDLVDVAASERSAGKRYGDAARWLEGHMPAGVGALIVKNCTPDEITAPIVFSALDSGVAGDVEAAFARAGRLVLSNAKNYRMADDVPLVIPEVNADHLALLDRQRVQRGWRGAIVTNANCATTVMAAALAPLHEAFTVTKVFATTMQAVSGAGYPGVPSLDILGNVVPFINDEEPKIESELNKLLGRYDGDRIACADIVTSAHANRVPVEHGHTVCMSVAFATRPSPEQALAALRAWRGHEAVHGLPSAPEQALIVRDEADRPQPRRDVDAGRGMSTTIGRVRADTLFDLKLVAMSHNVVRGAAGGSILNAELLMKSGRLAELARP
ncbi:aspartate-semialdehyde dehydrogenase [Gemmatimonas sp.]|uniref:aspartate-semialdehyde dehydrogenase n=1 Tax=Gemmatimonas sp. TaxID=1962908 RepID=UPI0025BE2E05|nr:aspartate-semialdehyde dehydrogenase [Gemmatimonas sp.]MCA2984386.1 aspartate-semialdehyde dehydrogenase [Gemmatimonas sp.]MCA2994089.1 aspartate-semialdehyde dehydrogenase [Gemmatimonas sp.]